MNKVVCPECDRSLVRQDLSEARDLVENHNESRHGGESVAYLTETEDPLTSCERYIEDVKMMESLRKSNNDDRIRVVCRECQDLEIVENLDEALELMSRHDEWGHEDSEAEIIAEDLDESHRQTVEASGRWGHSNQPPRNSEAYIRWLFESKQFTGDV